MAGKNKDKKKYNNYTSLLKDLLKKENNLWYDIAVCSYNIYKNKEWESLGYASAKDYALNELEPYGLSYTMFMYRVKMGEAIEKYDLSKEQIGDLGWTKFKEIASLILMDVDIEDINALIERAKESSSREVADFVREQKTLYADKEIVAKTVKMKFSLLNEQADIVNEALKLALDFAQTDNENIALTYICADFLMNHSTDNEVILKLREEVLKRSEAKKKVVHKPHRYSGRKK